jgi:predicted esterase
MLVHTVLVLLAIAPAPADAALPRGTVVETLHGADPEQTYALYLPSAYDPAHPAPIVYVLDPRGRALLALELFRPAAEALGFVLASSYRTRSDEKADLNTPALQAMWADTHARLALDDDRVFLAGFSGTARVAVALASAAQGRVRGVVGAGAGFEPRPIAKGDLGFLYFGASGDADFNYDEMQGMDETLFELGVPYRCEVFPGPHSWMPEAVATRALRWMALRSQPHPSEAVLNAAWSEDVARARELDAAGRLHEAWRQWSWIARDYAGRRDTSEAEARAKALLASEARKAESKSRRKDGERERAAIDRAQQTIAQAKAAGDDLSGLPQLLSDLRIAELRKKAAGEGPEALSARRVLSSVQSQVGFYLPRDASQRGAYAEAALYLTIASEIRPEDAQVWYHLAAAQARAGRTKSGLSSLAKALDAGFADRARLESDADLASLRRDPGYQKLVSRLP